RLDPQLPAGRCGEVGTLGLDPAGRPVAGAVPDRLDRQVPAAVLVHVRRAVGHPLDLAGASVGGAAGIVRTDVVEPVGPVEAGVRGAVEVVGEDQLVPGWRGRYGGS